MVNMIYNYIFNFDDDYKRNFINLYVGVNIPIYNFDDNYKVKYASTIELRCLNKIKRSSVKNMTFDSIYQLKR